MTSLECVFWGGTDIGPFKHVFDKVGVKRTIGIYNAAEGFIGFQDLDESGVRYRLAPTGFFEFAPRSSFVNGSLASGAPVYASREMNQTIINEHGGLFVLLFTTPGQIRREMDLLRVKMIHIHGYEVLRFQLAGRSTGFLHIVGEELIEPQVTLAVSTWSKEHGVPIEHFTLGPKSENDIHRHERVIELRKEYAESFSKEIDTLLKKINGDYADKRTAEWLHAPLFHFVPKGTFTKFLSSKNKLGGQNKVLQMSGERGYLDAVLAFIEKEHIQKTTLTA